MPESPMPWGSGTSHLQDAPDDLVVIRMIYERHEWYSRGTNGSQSFELLVPLPPAFSAVRKLHS